MGNPYYGAAMWSGIGSGISEGLAVVAQAFAQKRAEEDQDWQNTRAVYASMLSMADPEMKALGLTGLMQEKPKKGLFGHLQKDPNLEKARTLIQKSLAGAQGAPSPPPDAASLTSTPTTLTPTVAPPGVNPPPVVIPQQAAAMPVPDDGSTDASQINPSAAVGGAPQVPGVSPDQQTPGGAPPAGPVVGPEAAAPPPPMPGPPPIAGGLPGAQSVPEFDTHPYDAAMGLAHVNLAQERKRLLAENPMMSDAQFISEMKPSVDLHAKFVGMLNSAKALGVPYEQAAPAIMAQLAPVEAQIQGRKDVAGTVADAKIKAADKMIQLRKDLASGKYEADRSRDDLKFAHAAALKQMGASLGNDKIRLVDMADPNDETGIRKIKVPISEGDLKKMAAGGESFAGTAPASVATRLTSAYAAQKRIEEIQRDLPEIVEHVGPVAGRGSEALKKLGAQDPIVQKFLTDRAQVAAYLTSVHAARGQAFLNSMEQAMGSLTDNPAALKMAIDETHAGTQEFIDTMNPARPKPGGKGTTGPTPPPIAKVGVTPPSAPPSVGMKPPANPKAGDTWMSPTGPTVWDGLKWAAQP